MPIPTAGSISYEFLSILANSVPHKIAAVRLMLIERFGLTPAELTEQIPSRKETTFSNRLRNATYRLQKMRAIHILNNDVTITETGISHLSRSAKTTTSTSTVTPSKTV